MDATNNRLLLVLENNARVCYRYNLLTERDFSWIHSPLPKHFTSAAYVKARARIKGGEIIGDCNQDQHIAVEFFEELEREAPEEQAAILNVLDSPCDLSNLKWQEELATRRYRNRLARKYMRISIEEARGLYTLHLQEIIDRKEAAKRRETRSLRVMFLCLCIAISAYKFGPIVVDGLTPVDVLARSLYEDSKFRHDGSICRDGWISGSQGRGTCSHHGGVYREFAKGEYRITFEQARALAKERSWLQ